jgi:hypothetical protein
VVIVKNYVSVQICILPDPTLYRVSKMVADVQCFYNLFLDQDKVLKNQNFLKVLFAVFTLKILRFLHGT